MSEADAADVYRPPQAPLPRVPGRPWLTGFLLATLPSLLYFVVARWLPGWLTLILWIVVVVLTFYGVGVFVWSTRREADVGPRPAGGGRHRRLDAGGELSGRPGRTAPRASSASRRELPRVHQARGFPRGSFPRSPGSRISARGVCRVRQDRGFPQGEFSRSRGSRISARGVLPVRAIGGFPRGEFPGFARLADFRDGSPGTSTPEA